MNIDTIIFLANSYKIYSEAGAPKSEFLENLDNLLNDNQIEKEEHDAMVMIVTGEVADGSEGNPLETLYVKTKTSDGDGCSGPSYEYKPVTAKRATKVEKAKLKKAATNSGSCTSQTRSC